MGSTHDPRSNKVANEGTDNVFIVTYKASEMTLFRVRAATCMKPIGFFYYSKSFGLFGYFKNSLPPTKFETESHGSMCLSLHFIHLNFNSNFSNNSLFFNSFPLVISPPPSPSAPCIWNELATRCPLPKSVGLWIIIYLCIYNFIDMEVKARLSKGDVSFRNGSIRGSFRIPRIRGIKGSSIKVQMSKFSEFTWLSLPADSLMLSAWFWYVVSRNGTSVPIQRIWEGEGHSQLIKGIISR